MSPRSIQNATIALSALALVGCSADQTETTVTPQVGSNILVQVDANCTEKLDERELREIVAGKPNRAADYFSYVCNIDGLSGSVEVYKGPTQTVVEVNSKKFAANFSGFPDDRRQITFTPQ